LEDTREDKTEKKGEIRRNERDQGELEQKKRDNRQN